MATTTDLGTVRERSSGSYTCVLTDETGTAIPAASLVTLTLRLYDIATLTTLNNREGALGVGGQNVLNLNNVTVDSSGNLTWAVQSADHAVVSTKPRARERHRAVFEFTWASGAKRDWHALEFLVEAEPEVS